MDTKKDEYFYAKSDTDKVCKACGCAENADGTYTASRYFDSLLDSHDAMEEIRILANMCKPEFTKTLERI